MGENPTSSNTSQFSADEQNQIRRNPPAILDVRTLAIYLSQSERKTRDDIRTRRIPHFRLGGKILIRLTDLQRALDSLVVREM